MYLLKVNVLNSHKADEHQRDAVTVDMEKNSTEQSTLASLLFLQKNITIYFKNLTFYVKREHTICKG